MQLKGRTLVGCAAARAMERAAGRTVPSSRGWQVSHAYTVRVAMSQQEIFEPHLPHDEWL